MKRSTFVRTFVLALAASAPLAAVGAAPAAHADAPAAATGWEIDASHSSATFSVKHMMVSNVRGEFGKLTGSVAFDAKDWSKTQVDVTIDAASIGTRDEKRDAHLKSADFFDVEKFPTITFKSTKAEKTGKGKFKVTGDLTMHGVTKQVSLVGEGPTAETKDPWGFLRIGAHASTKVDRKDFGLSWNKALDAGGVVVGEEVTIALDVELKRKAD